MTIGGCNGRGGGRTLPNSQFNFLHFHALFGKNLSKQDCIPVGCILPTCWPYLPAYTVQGGLPCQGEGVVFQHAMGRPPREQNSWHTLVKILSCPKLRLRAVIIGLHSKIRGWRLRLGNPWSATNDVTLSPWRCVVPVYKDVLFSSRGQHNLSIRELQISQFILFHFNI